MEKTKSVSDRKQKSLILVKRKNNFPFIWDQNNVGGPGDDSRISFFRR
jgi:hypothetical protein